MRRPKLLRRILPVFILTPLVSILLIGSFASRSARARLQAQSETDLRARAQLLLAAADRLDDSAALDRLCKEMGERTGARLTLARADGRPIADSLSDPAELASIANHPDVTAARGESFGASIGFDYDLGVEVLRVAVVSGPDGSAIARVSIPTTEFERFAGFVWRRWALAAIVAAAASGLVGALFLRRVSGRIEGLRSGADRFADGDLDRPIAIPLESELGALAEALNRMAVRWRDRLADLSERSDQQEAVLTSMVEGVIAVDDRGRLIRMNEAAARLLGLDGPVVAGRAIEEVVRHYELQRFILRAGADETPIEDEIVLHAESARQFRVCGARLRDREGRGIGALVVMDDVTRLRRLENLRREFVANVSHELKTPITSIKGYVETLLDGTLEDAEQTRRFLSVVARQSDRLHSIVEDLLSLSRIEQGVERRQIELKSGSVVEVLQSAVQACARTAEARRITIDCQAARDLKARINPTMLEQAVVNLIDNAIKFSDEEGVVRIEAEREGREVWIRVVDRGCGIPPEHLERVFERFYRVDKARSRKQGGTGLGLSIVKHIAAAHGGRVSVESEPGKGSRFTIHLPAG
jgi:two-component system phosphate regulon sensor histidine kinase PhoR